MGKPKNSSIPFVVMLVASCGGGEGSEGPPVTAPPTTSPTPSPSSTPVPSPTTSPRTLDFSQDVTLEGNLALSSSRFTYTDAFGRSSSGYIASEWLVDGQSSSMIFRAAPEAVQIVFGDDDVSYSASDRTTISPFRRYSRQGNEVSIGWSDSKHAFQYVTAVFSRSPEEAFKFGENSGTRSSERIITLGYISAASTHIEGPLYYDGQPLLAGGFGSGGSLSAGRILLSVRSGANQVFGAISLQATENGNQVEKARLTFTGTIDDATNRITGIISDDGKGYTGAFKGALYGPAREEVAIIFRLANPAMPYTFDAGIVLAGAVNR